MATGVYTDFKIYNDEFYGGMFESVEENITIFNEASRGAIQLVQQEVLGHFEKESFFQKVSSLITRRDISSTASGTATKSTQGELIGVKLNRRYQHEDTLDAWKKIASNERELSFILGQIVGEEKVKDYLQTVIRALVGALSNQSAIYSDQTASNLTYNILVGGLTLFGDAAPRIIAWVMHSKPFYDLMGKAITDKVTNVADVAIWDASIGGLNRPIIVTDLSPLHQENLSSQSSDDRYFVLGLTAGGGVVKESEGTSLISETVTGLENLVFRVQGEHAFNVSLKGMAFSTSYTNPTDAQIGTGSNWTKVAADDKALPGICIRVK